MATVTGMTAAAMQAIADGVVVDGTVNGSGHLILTKQDESTIDAGSVIGPTGPAGADGTNGTDGSSLSLDELTTDNPTAANWGNNGHKIQNIANGSADTDVAALGQVMKKSGGTFTGAVADAVVALTFGTTIAVDASLGNDFRVTLTSSAGTLSNPTNLVDGQRFFVWVTQDSTGSRTLAYGTNYKFTTSVPSPTLSTAANAVDLLGFVYNATIGKCILVAFLAGVG